MVAGCHSFLIIDLFTDVSETASTASAAIHGVKRIFTSCLERDPDPYK